MFEVSLKSFVEERKSLAAALRVAKRQDAAKRVLAMAKPTPAAWALNQVARKQAALLTAYLVTHDAQASAQIESAGREQIFATAHAERAAKKAIVDQAVSQLQADGQKVSKAVLDALPTTLHAAAMDPALRSVLIAGRLQTDVEVADFSTLALLAASQGFAPVTTSPTPEAPAEVVAAPAPQRVVPERNPPKIEAEAMTAREASAREAQARQAEARQAEAQTRAAEEREANERRARLAAVELLRVKREQIAGTLRSARSDHASAAAALVTAQLLVAKTESAVARAEAALLAIEAECDEAAEASRGSA